VRLRHHARFDRPPFARDVTKVTIDPAPLHSLEDHTLIAMIEPADIGMGPMETFVHAALGEGLLNPALRANLSDRRIIVLGDIEGRREQRPVDVLAPTVAIAFELQSADGAIDELDQQMVKLARRIANHGTGRFEITVPNDAVFRDGHQRLIDISPASEWFTGSLPIGKPLTLNWDVVSEDGARYAVIASHPNELRDTTRALMRSAKRGDEDGQPSKRDAGRYQSCGTLNGVRISHHLESWAERPDLFFPQPAVDDGDEAQDHPQNPTMTEFQQTLRLMARLAAGIDRVRWRMTRPNTHEMRLDVQMTLTAPHSARPE
jgi:hypothetical protein